MSDENEVGHWKKRALDSEKQIMKIEEILTRENYIGGADTATRVSCMVSHFHSSIRLLNDKIKAPEQELRRMLKEVMPEVINDFLHAFIKLVLKGEDMSSDKDGSSRVVHLLNGGLPLCGFTRDPPSEWPLGHVWARPEHANEYEVGGLCPRCKEHNEEK